jgi:ATP-dependent DNA helicase RecG
MEENKNIDKKSLKFLKGKNTDWNELAKDCVCFANAQGGFIYIGIEDKATLPPEKQNMADRNLPDIIQKNIAHRTVNVGTQYAVNPEFIRKINFKGKTNLKNIEDYRLEELIYKDLTAYPNSGIGEIHQRIGMEINKHKVRRLLKRMVDNGQLKSEGVKKWTRYSIEQNLQENQ